MTRRSLPWLLSLAIVLIGAVWLWMSGRTLICTCGRVELFAGIGHPDGSSQHLTDWYTPSHLLHGILFFAALWLVARRLPLAWRLTIAVLVETAWEMVENSTWVIERYRQVTVSKDYNGDTVINSVADIAAMVLGFGLARVLPVWASVAIVIGFELLTAWLIRDGLALNVLMLLWPVDAVREWQAGV